MSYIPRPHEIYKHFKGNLYQITAVAEHTETGEQLVVYQAMYGDFKTYARPLSMFLEKVDREKYPDAAQEYRFELQGAEGEARREERARDSEAQGSEARDSEAQDSVARDSKARDFKARDSETRDSKAQDSGESSGFAAQTHEDNASDAGEELNLDPMLLQFLDADTYEERLNLLAGMRHRITDDMITIMAVACDVKIPDGETQERCESLKNCLLMLDKYECNRLR